MPCQRIAGRTRPLADDDLGHHDRLVTVQGNRSGFEGGCTSFLRRIVVRPGYPHGVGVLKPFPARSQLLHETVQCRDVRGEDVAPHLPPPAMDCSIDVDAGTRRGR